MTPEQYLATFDKRIDEALFRSAQVGLSDVVSYVPIDTRKLRDSGRAEKGRGFSYIIFGGQGIPYTRFQYYTAKRHLVRNGVPSRMLSILPSGERKKAVGQTNKQRYGRAYRYAIKNNLLATFPKGIQWFRFLQENQGLRNRMLRRFRDEFARGVQ